jgi:hypothetical protein
MINRISAFAALPSVIGEPNSAFIAPQTDCASRAR